MLRSRSLKGNVKRVCWLFLLSICVFIFWRLEETQGPVLTPFSRSQFHNHSNVSALKWNKPAVNTFVTTAGAGTQSSVIPDMQNSKTDLSVRYNHNQSKILLNNASSGLLISKSQDIRAQKMTDMLGTNRFYDRNTVLSGNNDEKMLGKLDKVYSGGKEILRAVMASKDNLDLMKLNPFEFLPNYKNPCWKTGEIRLPIACLPYFYLVGAPKAGTTDVFQRLKAHPDFAAPVAKEPHWLTRKRFYDRRIPGIRQYAVFYFGRAAAEIYKWRDGAGYHRKITGDCSASTLWDNYNWRLLPHNAGQEEPEHTNADYIYHINPATRIIVMLREPVSRLYSDFLFFSKNGTQATFHSAAVQAIALFNQCREKQSLRSCVYDANTEKRLQEPRARILIGIYHIHLQEYIRVFPRDQILVLKLEDYSTNPETAMKRIFQFLGLSESARLNLNRLQDSHRHANERHINDKAKGPMWTTTRDLLRNFYKPYNDALATLLKDSSFNYNVMYS